MHLYKTKIDSNGNREIVADNTAYVNINEIDLILDVCTDEGEFGVDNSRSACANDTYISENVYENGSESESESEYNFL